MTTVAIFKWAMNPHDERVFNGVAKWAAERPDVGDDDHAVVATALSAANGGEVVGLTTNPAGDLSFAAARGADRTVAIDSVPIEADALTIAIVRASASIGTGLLQLILFLSKQMLSLLQPYLLMRLKKLATLIVFASAMRPGNLAWLAY